LTGIDIIYNKMARKTLYQKLKPEVKGRIYAHEEKYECTVNKIITALKNNYFYEDLTIGIAKNIELFSDTLSESAFDFKYGVSLFDDLYGS